MKNEILHSLEYIEKEKGISSELLFETLELALASACKKTYPAVEEEDIAVTIDRETGEFHIVVEGKPIDDPSFGRIAAQTAKQVIMQKIREAEREALFDEFASKEGDLVSGVVHLIERRAIIVSLGKAQGILPQREQFDGDDYRRGQHLRFYVVEVKQTNRGPEIILSRSHPLFVKRLFELEVPEIADGIVEIKAVAREAGSRTKIAVVSNDHKVDCVGSCVGMRGQRVKNIVRELQGEKIDIVRWDEAIYDFIKNALSPAELTEIHFKEEGRAEVIVPDDQLSLAIGKKGQNVRLASRLTGLEIDVRSASQKIPLSSLDGIGAKTEAILRGAGVETVKDIIKAGADGLAEIEGIGNKTAEKIATSAHRLIIEGDKSKMEELDSLL